MEAFLGTLVGNLIISVGIIVVIFSIRLFKNKFISYIDYIVALTVGILLAIVFLGFFPEIIEESDISGFYFGFFILLGLLFFYILELFLHWHHCKDLEHDGCSHHKSLEKEHMNSKLMFSGTFLHNALHGIVLFNAFSVDLYIGIATTFVIFLHSIPQNVSNYFMNHKNIKYSYIAALGGLFGAILTYPFLNILIENRFYILLFIAGGLLYTALTDILPEVKEKANIKSKLLYFGFVVLGVLLFVGFNNIIGHHHIEETLNDNHIEYNDSVGIK